MLRAVGGGTLEDVSRLLDDGDGMQRLMHELDDAEERNAEPG